MSLESADSKQAKTIQMKHIPSYIKQDLRIDASEMVEIFQMSEIKCGQKIGKKISDADSKWCEKWFEIKCKDYQGAVKPSSPSKLKEVPSD